VPSEPRDRRALDWASSVIRAVVVEDDYHIADWHRQLTERVEGFSVVGIARTGAEALALVERTRPDLILLDVYLPDMSGIDLLQALRAPERPAVDVVAITAAKDVATLRAAMQGGVLHYLIKPFRGEALQERLRGYAAARARMTGLREADQREIDRVFGLLRAGSVQPLPKGLSQATLDAVVGALEASGRPVSAEEVAERVGVSRVTARRYLDHLAQSRRVEVLLRYGSPGRPEHRYRLAGSP
jgi:response regulator of citrate/malate metabolism